MQQNDSASTMARVLAARGRMILDVPFWGALAAQVKVVLDTSCDTAWTDGVRVGWSPKFVAKCNQAELIFVWAHEIAHNALGHPWRRGNRDHDLWNQACDYVINGYLKAAGFTLPKDVLYDKRFAGKGAEDVYAVLADERRKNQPPPPPPPPAPQDEQEQGEGEPGEDSAEGDEGTGGEDEGDEQGDEDGSSEGQGEGDEEGEGEDSAEGGDADGEGEGDEEGEGDGEIDWSKVGESRDAGEPEPGEDETSAEEWQQRVQEAANMTAMRGEGSGGMDRFVAAATEVETDWRSLLREFFASTAPVDYSYRTPSRRYVPSGLYLPSLSVPGIGHIAIAIDTSGSIDERVLSAFGAEVQEIVREMKPERVTLLWCDSRVHRIDTFEQGEEVVFRPVGGGGTDFRPVFTAVEQMNEPPVCLVYLTDLEGTFPREDPGLPTLWAWRKAWSWQTQPKVPFGEVVAVQR
jgi:predicted metal-dependent peptidase